MFEILIEDRALIDIQDAIIYYDKISDVN